MIETMYDFMSICTILILLLGIIIPVLKLRKKHHKRNIKVNESEFYREFDDIEDEEIY